MSDSKDDAAPKTRPSRTMVSRWGGKGILFQNGFVAVPTRFLEARAAMRPFQLTPTEALFIIDLMAHKWDHKPPYPGYRRLAKWMGKTDGYVRRLARALEIKGFLKRRRRIGATNEFDLTPLFAKLEHHITSPPAVSVTTPARRRRKAK